MSGDIRTGPVSFEFARRAEAYNLAELARDLVETGLPWTWTAPRLMRSIQSPDTVVLVARCREQICGFAVMYYAAEHAHLNLLAVAPAWRRRGIGARMLAWLEKSASVAGITTVYLETRADNLAARRFYHMQGYVEFETVEDYYSDVEPAVRMAHDLRAGRAHGASPLPFG